MALEALLGVHELPNGGLKAGSHGKLEESRNGREELFVTNLVSLIIDYGRGVLLLSLPPPLHMLGQAHRRSSQLV